MKTKNLLVFSSALMLFSFQMSAYAVPDISVASTVLDSIKAVTNTSIMPMALKWLGAFFALQFVITNYGLLKSGADIEAVFLKMAGSMVWFGVCVYILNNGPDLIDKIGTGAMTTFASDIPTFGAVLTSTLTLCVALITGIGVVGAPIIGFPGLANVLVGILFAVFSAGTYLAIKIFMLQLELGLIIMLSPLSFSLLGLNALRDQGIAPFKSILSLVYRIILMGVIASAFGHVIDVMSANMDQYSWVIPTQWPGKVSAILSGLMAFPVLCYLLWKSDSIAASLASGTTDMAPSDIGSAVSAGVAGGMAAHAATQTAAAGVTKMSDVLKNMMGGGEMKNAGGTGSGNPSSQPIPDASALSSLSSSGGQPSMSLDDVRKSEQASAGGGAGDAAGGAAAGGSGSGTSAVPFSKEDGAKAAGEVPASAGQSSKNAAAVGAAMRASGASETMAVLAENIVADGGSAQGVANACGTTPAQNAAVDNALAGASDPAWLNSGSAVSPGGSSANAGIGGSSSDSTGKSNPMSDLGRHLSNANHHSKEDKATVGVSINTHADS